MGRVASAIDDYAVIGDSRSVALVAKDGSIDWLCWPRFDSPSLFGALLDPNAGYWRIGPADGADIERRYLPETNVLETRFRTGTGTAVLTDLMPVASESQKHRQTLPDHEVLRVLRCESGEVEIAFELEPRPAYGGRVRKIRDAGALGIRLELGRALLTVRSQLPLRVEGSGRISAVARLRAGEVRASSLTYVEHWPMILCPLGRCEEDAVARSVAWWRRWAGRLRYDGPMRDAVVRSALLLKLLVFAPSGAIVAAPTTSLPEREGGDLNWDYRYCWLRDASLTARALYGLGCEAEADAFVSWLLHATRLSQPELKPLYDVYGRRPVEEYELGNWAGYRDSRPVRIGNGAVDQLQLDVYGEVIDAATRFVRVGHAIDREIQRSLLAWGRYVCANWALPDEGLWEPRQARLPHTHSRLLCWVALDRLVSLCRSGCLENGPVEEFERERDRIRADIEAHGFDRELDTYVGSYGAKDLDAAVLQMAWYGFARADSSRLRATWEQIDRRLGTGGALLYRYVGPEGPQEGTFVMCSFWGAEFLALMGEVDHGLERFEGLCALGNDVGLFAEEQDPETGRALGNFPQAFTHVGLINAALTFADRLRGGPRASPTRSTTVQG